MKRALLILTHFFLVSCSCPHLGGLVVTHKPNPSDIHSSAAFPKPPYPFMWYYRTEITNTTDQPLRIVWFEGYAEIGGQWQPNNVKGRTLTGEDFGEWYTEGTLCPHGLIPPRATAACDPNWHGSTTKDAPRRKWSYKAIDPKGNEYSAESIVTSAPILP